jgi:CDP-diacylglycerol--serine O-phosphatidyltransferase
MILGALAVLVCLFPSTLATAEGLDAVTLASGLIVLALVADGLDGAVARRWGGSPLGLKLDSASDLVSFGMAPGVLLATAYWDHGSDLGGFPLRNAMCVAVALLFAAAGLKRLMEFTRTGHRLHRFRGLATPAAALTCVVMVHVLPGGSNILTGYPDPFLQLGLLGVTALLMVAPLEYPKVRGYPGLVLALAMTACLAYLAIRKTVLPLPEEALYPQYMAITLLGLVFTLFYVLGGAIYAAVTGSTDRTG